MSDPVHLHPLINPEKPLVFFDIDGVVNHELYYRSDVYAERRAKDQGEDYHYIKNIDPKSIEILNEIHDWNFVLSSTWRRNRGLNKTQQALEANGFKGTLIDSTPVLGDRFTVRGNEIYAWLQMHISTASNYKNYIILDDDSDMLLWQAPHFECVDGYCGLTPNNIYRAKRALGIYK